MIDLFNFQRRQTSVTSVGRIAIGGENPVRIQSMTTTNTNDTEACVAQAERIIKAGGELVRLTTQGIREAENLQNISKGIRNDGFATPLVADVHFNPNVADVAARYAEKVRVNPGNYVDPAHTFLFHLANKQAHSAHHDNRIARFDGDNYILKFVLFANTKEL